MGKIEGVLKDPNGNPIANATVTLSNGMSVTSDATGHFSFGNVTAGSYTLTVSGNGYKTITQHVNATPGLTNTLDSLNVQPTTNTELDTTMVLGIVALVIVVLFAGFVIYRRRSV
jgi:endo-alpha-N-acetylgalactosaminidase